MNQKERMLSGLPYKAWLDGLSQERLENKKKIYAFNHLEPDRVDENDRGFERRNAPLPDLSDRKVFPGGIRVKALFARDMKWRLIEEFGPHCFTEADDGRLLFAADYTDMDNLVSWILSFGDKAEVLEPAEARNRIRKIAENLEKTYRR